MQISTMVFKEEDDRDSYVRELRGDIDVDIMNGPYVEFGVGDSHRRVYVLTKHEIENKLVNFGNNRFCIVDDDDEAFINTWLVGSMFPQGRVVVDEIVNLDISKYVSEIESILNDKIVRLS